MTSTTLMPLDPALSPQRISRVLTISANLMPEEIVSARRARRSRGWVVVVLVLVVALLAGWYVWADRTVDAANSELSEVTAQATTLQKSQTRYQEVVDVQNQTSTISKQLKTLLTNDLTWAKLLDTLRQTGDDSGVQVLGIAAVLDDKTAGAGQAETLPNANGVTTIGTITITGSAPDKPSIAKYVDALGRLESIANPYLTNATKTEKKWSYSIQANVSSTTLCGRFTVKCKTGGN